MATLLTFLKRHPVWTYFALTFALSWGGVLLVIGGPGGIPGTPEQLERLLPTAIAAMLVGPSVAGILLTGLVGGRAGLRELLSRLLKWRVGARYYAIALLIAPLVMAAVLVPLSLVSTRFVPGLLTTDDKIAFILFGLMAGLAAGFFEELGWTGFAVPALRPRWSLVATGLLVGVPWAAWHFLTNVAWASGASSGALSIALFVVASTVSLLVGVLPAYRVLMVWVYDRTGSLLVATLMHASLTACTLILGPEAIAGGALLIYGVAVSAAMWVVAVAAAKGDGGVFHRFRPAGAGGTSGTRRPKSVENTPVPLH